MSVNNGGGCTNMAQLVFTTSCSGGASPTPTGVQNRADTDASTTNAVGFVVFSPTPTVTRTITTTLTYTITRTLTQTSTQTLTQTLTRTLTQTVTMTLTQTYTVTRTQTLTPTITVTVPPVVIELTKTIDKNIFSLGEVVNYCLVYTNNGTANASFTIWDTIPAVTDFVSCTGGCSQVTIGPDRLLVWNINGLGVGSSSQVCFVVQINRLPMILREKEFFAMFERKNRQADIYARNRYFLNSEE